MDYARIKNRFDWKGLSMNKIEEYSRMIKPRMTIGKIPFLF
jgi:hypothetical protein|tara:strand:+ start:147 stop:269 length:123 start_codon:yes stop_codon:yes gene_type:complete